MTFDQTPETGMLAICVSFEWPQLKKWTIQKP